MVVAEFKQYRRTGLSEMRPVTKEEATLGYMARVSISDEDQAAGSPKLGDMVARNPKNHDDQWLVAKKYFDENLEEV